MFNPYGNYNGGFTGQRAMPGPGQFPGAMQQRPQTGSYSPMGPTTGGPDYYTPQQQQRPMNTGYIPGTWGSFGIANNIGRSMPGSQGGFVPPWMQSSMGEQQMPQWGNALGGGPWQSGPWGQDGGGVFGGNSMGSPMGGGFNGSGYGSMAGLLGQFNGLKAGDPMGGRGAGVTGQTQPFDFQSTFLGGSKDFGPTPPGQPIDPFRAAQLGAATATQPAGGGSWNGMDRQSLTGQGKLGFTFDPSQMGGGNGLSFGFSGVGQGAMGGNQYQAYLTDAQGNRVGGMGNGSVGRFNAMNLVPGQQYFMNYNVPQGQTMVLSGNKR